MLSKKMIAFIAILTFIGTNLDAKVIQNGNTLQDGDTSCTWHSANNITCETFYDGVEYSLSNPQGLWKDLQNKFDNGR